MSDAVETALKELSPIQRDAVSWTDGAALVLAGPGSGKTRVLTTRIAKLLNESQNRRFKILALTFTTKAAAEMRERVERLVPGLADERTYIGTFHAFSTVILRQHGSHIGFKPDFAIIDRKEERSELLRDALRSAMAEGRPFSLDDIRWLDTLDELKARLVVPEKAHARVRDQHFPEVYALYEEALKAENACDFNGLILESCRLLAKMPAIAKRVRQTYPYWMIDEFQIRRLRSTGCSIICPAVSFEMSWPWPMTTRSSISGLAPVTARSKSFEQNLHPSLSSWLKTIGVHRRSSGLLIGSLRTTRIGRRISGRLPRAVRHR